MSVDDVLDDGHHRFGAELALEAGRAAGHHRSGRPSPRPTGRPARARLRRLGLLIPSSCCGPAGPGASPRQEERDRADDREGEHHRPEQPVGVVARGTGPARGRPPGPTISAVTTWRRAEYRIHPMCSAHHSTTTGSEASQSTHGSSQPGQRDAGQVETERQEAGGVEPQAPAADVGVADADAPVVLLGPVVAEPQRRARGHPASSAAGGPVEVP